MKKRLLRMLLACVLALSAGTATAGDFFVKAAGIQFDNFWPNVINGAINGAIGSVTDFTGVGLADPSFVYSWHSVKDSQGKLDVDGGRYFGFKARDLFRHFRVGPLVGWQPKFSMLGLYAFGGYEFRQFNMQPDRLLEGMEKYRLPGWFAGIGLRLTPSVSLLENKGWCPIVELESTYSSVFSVKAPYGNSADQINKGMSTRFALGLRRANGLSSSIGYTLQHKDYFNRDFVAPDGTLPYADIKSRLHTIDIVLRVELNFE